VTSAIVLAAGASSRMGRAKALLDVGGRPAVEVVCDALRTGGADEVVVVVGRHAAEIRAGARPAGVRIVDNPRWSTGRTSSVQAGLAALERGSEWTLLALVDMPLVRADTVRAIVEAADGAGADVDVVVPVHRGRRGHPIALRRTLFPRIAALGPDEPLNVLVRAARALEAPVEDEGVLVDFDEPRDVRPST
jgi:CTP:molybdopterin cytidylyltransferase MocA